MPKYEKYTQEIMYIENRVLISFCESIYLFIFLL